MAAGDAVDSMYMDNLDEFVNDENKIVTYRWLSTTLQVHVNQAKQMLYNFVIHQRNGDKEDNLNVTYFVAGLQKNEDSTKIHRCEVVSESNLEAVKSTLQELYSCHIYSVQKSKLQESDALYITDYNLMKENVFESCKQSSIQFDAKRLVAKSESFVPEIKKELITPSAALLNSDAHQKKSESKEKTTGIFKNHGGAKSSKMGSIAGMFAKSNVKKESPKNDEQNQNVTAEAKPAAKKESKESKKPSGVMSFFANSSAKTKPSEEKPSIIKKESSVVSEKKRTEHKKKPASSDSDDDFVQKKKRRRIKDDLFDSSSSEEEEEMETEDPLPSPAAAAAAAPDSEDDKKDDEEDEDEDEEEKDDEEEKAESMEEDESPIPDTPEQKKVKKEEPAATVQVTSDGRRRKHIKRKKKKTYLNDEGFMVTETVMESDSTDASDVEQPPSNNSNSSIQKKFGSAAAAAKTIADKGKQKQSSLMAFFQKK